VLADGPRLVFRPSLQECWELIHKAFSDILLSAEQLPRVGIPAVNPCNPDPCNPNPAITLTPLYTLTLTPL
jgi:hypothetical protein